MSENVVNVDDLDDAELGKLTENTLKWVIDNQTNDGIILTPGQQESTQQKLRDLVESNPVLTANPEELQKKLDTMALIKVTKVIIDI